MSTNTENTRQATRERIKAAETVTAKQAILGLPEGYEPEKATTRLPIEGLPKLNTT